MKISVAAAALACATYASGSVTIPANLPNGVYEAQQQLNPDHRPIIKRVDDSPAAGRFAAKRSINPKRKHLLEQLPLAPSYAYCRRESHTVALADFHAAVNRLFYTPLFWMPRKSVRFAMHNGAVAYLCNLGGWSAASLIEYMEATRILDERCPSGRDGRVRAAKLSITDWGTFHGREVAGVPICQWETEPGGLKNDLLEKQKEGCQNYVSPGVRTILDGEIKCDDDFMGPGFWEKMRMMFPWYTRPQEAVQEVQISGGD